jgi:hypothetical protein
MPARQPPRRELVELVELQRVRPHRLDERQVHLEVVRAPATRPSAQLTTARRLTHATAVVDVLPLAVDPEPAQCQSCARVHPARSLTSTAEPTPRWPVVHTARHRRQHLVAVARRGELVAARQPSLVGEQASAHCGDTQSSRDSNQHRPAPQTHSFASRPTVRLLLDAPPPLAHRVRPPARPRPQ